MQAKEKSKLSSVFGRVSFLVAILFLLVYLVTILTNSSIFFTESAEKNALIYFEDDMKRAEYIAEVHYSNLYEIAEKTQYSDSKEQIDSVFKSYIGSEKFGYLYYFSKGVAYNPTGAYLDDLNYEVLEQLSSSKSPSCTELFHYTSSGYDCIAFFIPVRGSQYIDGIMSIVPARNVVSLKGAVDEKSSAAVLVDKNGKVLTSETAVDFNDSVGNDLYEFLSKLTTDKTQINVIGDAIASGETSICSLDTPNSQYAVSLAPVEAFDGNFWFLTLSPTDRLIGTETVYVRHIITLIIIAIASLLIGLAYAIGYYKKMHVALQTVSYTDPVVGCPNSEQFKSVALQSLQSRKDRFSVAVFEIRQFRFMSEKLDEAEITELLKYIAKVMETFCAPREIYGYLGDGKFVLLIVADSNDGIRDRVRLVEAMVSKHAVLGQSKSKKKFNVGVCACSTARRDSIEESVNRALIACDKAKNNVNVPYEVYTEKVNFERHKNDRIEAEMENALATGEFKLFLQPKYNVGQDRIDSAEALVRWFDPKTGDYRFPGEFIGLFETNGFITKLDHFMYLEALKALSSAAERGEKVVPISVNVSLVTVNNDDFLDFYIENKKKYQVADGFVKIEFTESFAMTDYRYMLDIVTKLHNNGIKCSLDDFGTGYASLSALKHIPFDEIKLDRMFLGNGYNKEYDKVLLKTVTELAKSLNMTVVQEGVETKEMFDSAVNMGCDVIQGYYYAKAIPVAEYKLFINSNTSIKYKSLVK